MQLSQLLKLGLALAVGVAAAAACTRERVLPKTPRTSLLSGANATVSYRSPAVWRYHPQKEATLVARLDLPDGRIVLAGERGERWLVERKTGRISAAARLAPEKLVAVLKRDDGFLFVGQSGSSYESEEPIGPFVRASAPLDRLVTVSATGSAIVGVSAKGQLLRSADGGVAWKVVSPDGVRFVDVVLAKGGQGVAVAVPEALYVSADGGATWKKGDVDPVGATDLRVDRDGGAVVQGALGAYGFSGGAAPKLTRLAKAPVEHRYQLTKPPPRGPDGSALDQGRALVLGTTYLELAQTSNKRSSDWQLWRGPVDGALKAEPFDLAKGCRSVRLAGHQKRLAFACSKRNVGALQELELHLSTDGGKSWEREPYDLMARLTELSLAVGASGEILLSGICPPYSRARGCNPYGVYYRRKASLDGGTKAKSSLSAAAKASKGEAKEEEREAPAWELALAATPSLDKSARALSFSPDGTIGYAVGRRTKTGAYALYVSRDGGKSFDAHEIESLQAASGDFDDDDEPRFARPPRSTSGAQVLTLAPGEDGSVAITFKQGDRLTLVLADQEGQIVQIASAPDEATLIGAVGARALAVAPGSGRVWESLDGGASWDAVGRLPMSICPGDGSCQTPLACHPTGCVLGDELSRLGWRGQADDDQSALSAPDRRAGDLFDRRVRTPISCTLEEGGWRSVAGLTSAPAADQAAIGKVAWFYVVRDEARAAARVLHGIGGAKPKVESVELLAPVPRPQEYALTVSTQVEGAAALRYRTPEASGQSRLAAVEVAWENLFEGKLTRARIPDAGAYSPGDYSRIAGATQVAAPDMISIASGGLYLRVHRSARDDQPTYFVDGRTVVTVPPVPWPSSRLATRNTEMARVSGQHVPVRVLADGAVLLRARRDGSGWAFDAFTTGLATPKSFGLVQYRDIAYVGGQPGLHLTLMDRDGLDRRSAIFPFTTSGAAAGPPVAVPTQRDTGDQPKRCGGVTKESTPRVIIPYQGGTRHPIIVSDATEPVRVLLTSRAVMHGTPAEPCVAAFDAEGVVLDPSDPSTRQDRALILLDDLEHAWIFKSASDDDSSKLEYRQMSCRFDPSAEVPFEVYGQTGTLVGRGH